MKRIPPLPTGIYKTNNCLVPRVQPFKEFHYLELSVRNLKYNYYSLFDFLFPVHRLTLRNL